MTEELFNIPEHVREQYNCPNPMVRKVGKDPEGRKCKACHFLVRKRYHCKTYYKCEYRGDSNGAGTDHRVKWDACKMFKPEVK